uniref:Uncharacterized protein n=1 Tax=Nelumbo nucifera TaxID=4432 RepID=A0A822XDZ7_NELNU|nr:TPA_asm: hypothetical protein HUJ06_021137 [Nelumbo nucifera]
MFGWTEDWNIILFFFFFVKKDNLFLVSLENFGYYLFPILLFKLPKN